MSRTSEPKALKILSSKPSNNDKHYIFNKEHSTYIEVPKTVLNTLNKINELPSGLSLIFSNQLALAINYRRLENISNVITNWSNSEMKFDYYPQCKANLAFSKSLNTYFKEMCPNFSENERQSLVFFFAKCPHGYDVSNLIKAHSEMKPVIT